MPGVLCRAPEMARRIDVTLDGLHQLLHRIERKELVDGDWAICGALVLQLITRMQGKQDRMAAKLWRRAPSQLSSPVVEGQLAQQKPRPSRCRRATQAPARRRATQAQALDEKKAKGHGRNGATAFVNAKHFVHALADGLLGALCAACELGRLTPVP